MNNQLCETNDTDFFVTVWLAAIQLSTGKGVEVNAGHEHPMIRRAGGQYELVRYRHSLPLGTMAGAVYREHEFQLSEGDSLFVYTDGVPEAGNPEGAFFGTERSLETLNEAPDASPQDTLVTMMDRIDRFAGDAEQFDDITMLCFRYLGSPDSFVSDEPSADRRSEQ